MSDSTTINRPQVIPDEKVKEPKLYAVLVHNDPFTPRGFVVEVIQRYFQKTADEATAIMLRAHQSGVGAVGVYTRELAETKAALANKYSKDQGKLLLFSVEEN
jgi:ATP-dependent Clp protease adaptor protein ClpS